MSYLLTRMVGFQTFVYLVGVIESSEYLNWYTLSLRSASCNIIHYAGLAIDLQIAASHTPSQLARKIAAAVFNTYGWHREQLDCNAHSVSPIDKSVIILRECFLTSLVPAST